MSLVIISITDKQVYIASDKRSVNALNNYEFIGDDSVKILEVRKGIYFNGGGVSFKSEKFKKILVANRHQPVKKLIKLVSNFERTWEWPGEAEGKNPELERTLEVFLTGVDDETNQVFLLQGNRDGTNELKYLNMKAHGCFIYSFNTDVMSELFDQYMQQTSSGVSSIQAVNNCMAMGAELDPKMISPTFDAWSINTSSQSSAPGQIGEVLATSGKIGNIDIKDGGLSIGAIETPRNPSDPWTPGSKVARLLPGTFLYRENAAERGKIKQIAFNIYPDSTIDPFSIESIRITNTIPNTSGGSLPGHNKALVLEASGASGAGLNLAIDVISGGARFNGAEYQEQIRVISDANATLNDTDRYVAYWGVGKTLTLPSNPRKGRVIEISTLASSGSNTISTGGWGVIYAKSYPGNSTNSITLQFSAKFVWDGGNWIVF